MTALVKGLFSRLEGSPKGFEISVISLNRASYQRLVSGAAGTRARMQSLGAQFDVTPQ